MNKINQNETMMIMMITNLIILLFTPEIYTAQITDVIGMIVIVFLVSFFASRLITDKD